MRLREWFNRGFPYVLSLQLIFAFLQLLDFFRVVYYPNINRVTATAWFELGLSLVLPLLVLALYWVVYTLLSGRYRNMLACMPLVFCLSGVELGLSLATLCMCLMGVVYLGDRGSFFRVLLWIMALFQGLGVVHYGVFVPLGVNSPLEGVTMLQLRVHYILGYFTPLLVLPFLYFWVLRPLIEVNVRLPRLNVGDKMFDSFSRVLLVFSIYVSIYAALYPYFPAVNPGGSDFGVDVQSYFRWFQGLSEGGGLSGVVGENRAFLYLVVSVFKWLTGLDAQASIRFLPVLLNPLFIVASFYFSWECFEDSRVAAWCAFFSSTGFFVTVGAYSYFLTNDLALVLVLFSLGFLFRAVRFCDYRFLVVACMFGVFLVFTHSWTMYMYLASLVLLVGYYLVKKSRVTAQYVGGYLAVVALFEVIKILFFSGSGEPSATASIVSGLIGLADFWSKSIFGFRYLYGGFMSNNVPLLLAVLGVYVIDRVELPERYLAILLVLSSLVFFLSDETNKSRLLYNLPLGLFASLCIRYEYEKKDLALLAFIVFNSLFYLLISIGNVVWV